MGCVLNWSTFSYAKRRDGKPANEVGLQVALHGGEDYELLFTASPKTTVPGQLGGVLTHAIGRMKKPGKGPQVQLDRGGKRIALAAGGWEHFR